MCRSNKVFAIYFVLFLCFHVNVRCLSIESNLGSNEDCFERVALGRSLPLDQTTENKTDISLSDCEKLCLAESKCESFDYGVGARGNSTCHLSSSKTSDLQKSEKVKENNDYDLYSRRPNCELAPPTPLKPTSGGTITPKPISSTTPSYRPYFERPIYQHDKWDNYVYRKYQNPTHQAQTNAKPVYQNDDPNIHIDKPVQSQLISYSPNIPSFVQESQYESVKPHVYHEDHTSQYVPIKPSYQSESSNQMDYSSNPHFSQETSYSSNKPQLHNQNHNSQYATQAQHNSGSLFDYNQNQYSNVPSLSQTTWSSLNRPYPQTNEYGTQNYQKPNNVGHYNQNIPIAEQSLKGDQTSYSMNRPPSYNRPQFIRPEIYNEIPKPISNTNNYNKYIYNANKQTQNFGFRPQSSSFISRPDHQNSYIFQRPIGNYGSEENYLNYDVSDYLRPNNRYNRPSYFSQTYNSSIRYKKPYSPNEYLGNSYSQENNIHYDSQSTYQDHHYRPSHHKPQKPIYQELIPESDYSGQLGHNSRPQSIYNQNKIRPNSASYGFSNPASILYRPWLQPDGSLGKPNPGYNLNFNDKPETFGHVLYKPASNYGNEPTEPAGVSMSSHYGTSTGTPPRPIAQDENRPDPESYNPNNFDLNNGFDKPTTSNGPTYGTETTNILQNNHNIPDTTQYLVQKPQTSKPNYENNDEDFGVAQGGTYGPSLINRPQYSFPHTNRPQHADSSNYWSSLQTYQPQYQIVSNQHNIYDSVHMNRPQNPLYGTSTSNNEQPNHEHNYGSSNTNRPQHTSTNKPNQQVKPVYEYEKPSITRPIYVHKPGGQVVPNGQVSIGSGSSYGRPGIGHITELKPTYTMFKTTKLWVLLTILIVQICLNCCHGFRSSRVIVVEDAKTCYRRVVAGKRVLRGHVQRALACESLVDCQRACADEVRFHCESFNYKLDPSNRGKGLCELMEKPIEHLDLEKDFVEDKEYDFYELDRNSLQPDCALTWPGVPYPSSGFLGGHNRPQNNWQSSQQSGYGRWGSKFEDEERYNRFNTGVKGYNRIGYNDRIHYVDPHGSLDRRRGYGDDQKYQNQNYSPNKRIPIGFDKFVPYQIAGGRNEEETWGRYGGSYGSMQEHGREDKDSYDYWGLGEVDNTQYYKSNKYPSNKWHGQSYSGLGGRDFNYGSLGRQNWDGGNDVDSFSYGYGGAGHGSQWNYQKSRESLPVSGFETTGSQGNNGHSYGGYTGADNSYGNGPDQNNDGCSSRRRTGAGLGSRAVRLSLRVYDVLACEAACFHEVSFKCVSYSFRYSKQETENCFLSEVPYKGLDLTTDSGSDVYTMQGSSCRGPSTKPWIESECFWHVRAGRKLTHNAINTGLITSGLGACEAECIRAHNFVCRAFSFRFGSPTIGDDPENCLLTSLGSTELADSWNSLEASEGHELYARGSFGRGCEPTVLEEIVPTNKEEQCYLQYDSTARLLPPAVRYPTHAKDSHSCREACSKARLDFEQSAARAKRSFNHHHAHAPLVRCMSYSFSSDPHIQSNCLLSDIRLIDLQLGLDYEHSKQDWLFAFDLFNKECWSNTIATGPHHNQKHGDHGYIPDGQFTPDITRPSLPPIIPGLGPTSLKPPHPVPAPTFDVYHPFIPSSSPGHQFIPTSSPGYPFIPPGPTNHPFKPTEPEIGFGSIDTGAGSLGYFPHGGQGGNQQYDYFNDEGRGAWSQYTVSGWPCRAGSRCAPNQVTSYWSCELEGGEVGAWDYCCTPEHHCGYSEGFNKPWCYVGPSRDQWRPCNDKYYPYHQTPPAGPSPDYATSGPDNNYHNSHHSSRPAMTEHYGTSGNIPTSHHRPGSYQDYDTRPPLSSSGHGYASSGTGRPYYHGYDGTNRNNGYVRIPTVEGPRIQYHHNGGPQHSDNPHWVPVPPPRDHNYLDPSSSGFGTPRYWPVAYLHKSSPPNTTYYNQNENNMRPNDRKDKFDKPDLDYGKRPNESNQVLTIDTSVETHRNDIVKNTSEPVQNVADVIPDVNEDTAIKEKDETPLNNPKNPKGKVVLINNAETTTAKIKNRSIELPIEGIDDKLEFSDEDIEILNLDEAKTIEKKEKSNLEILKSEEKQIEALGRLLASRRDSVLIEKRSQNENDAKNIKIAFESTTQKSYIQNKFDPVSKSRPERRGLIQKIPKEYVSSLLEESKEVNDPSSLEVGEPNYYNSASIQNKNEHPTSDIRKTSLNGQIFYDATLGKEESNSNSSYIKEKADESGNSSQLVTTSYEQIPFGQRMAKTRKIEGNYNLRKGRRNYNPDEVRKRLLQKQSAEVV